MTKWAIILGSVALAATAVACGSGDDKDPANDTELYAEQTAAASSGGATTPQAQSTPAPQPTQGGGTATGKQYNAEPPMTIDENKRYFATIKMEIGDIKLELFPKDAPHHVNNFVFLAREGFYDGVTFHRVIPGFMAQGGDPTGTGRGGPGYNIPDEVNARQFLDGTLGMAKTNQPNSAGSQWFICYGPQAHLDGGYTAFGQVVEGRDVLDKIAPRDPASATAPGTQITTIVIEEE